MNIYKIERRDKADWDEYGSAVVFAESEEKARLIHPSLSKNNLEEWWNEREEFQNWCEPEEVIVTLLGTAKEGSKEGVIVSSYNAG